MEQEELLFYKNNVNVIQITILFHRCFLLNTVFFIL